jgi:DNA-binding NtrC family response regulator
MPSNPSESTPSRIPVIRGRDARGAPAFAGWTRDPLARGVVGASPRMQRIFRLIERVAPTESAVLLLGESGTGKELVARLIHLQSRRAAGPFVPVNVAALPETLFESELFGFARGAFTGAVRDRAGLVEQAEGGTLFLDEVGDMPPAAQVKLLRTIESGELRRLGEHEPRMVNVRVVAATHRDLLAEAAAGRFREDLYYRLNVVQVELPPLRERREDIGLLAAFFLDGIAEREARGKLAFTPEAESALEHHDWPGNVRELRHAVEHAVAVSEGPRLGVADLPATVRTPRLLPRRPREEWTLEEVEREHILATLERHRGNTTAAARHLGVSRTTLWRRLRRYGVTRRDLGE